GRADPSAGAGRRGVGGVPGRRRAVRAGDGVVPAPGAGGVGAGRAGGGGLRCVAGVRGLAVGSAPDAVMKAARFLGRDSPWRCRKSRSQLQETETTSTSPETPFSSTVLGSETEHHWLASAAVWAEARISPRSEERRVGKGGG